MTRAVVLYVFILIALVQSRAGLAMGDHLPVLKDFSKSRFKNASTQKYCQADLRKEGRVRSLDLSYWIVPENEGGTLGIGNCWWHSAFQRHSFYRVVMRPELKAPSANEAVRLLEKIGRGRGVVEIPGFKTLREFTGIYRKETLRVIDNMHVWMNGIEEALRLPPLGAATNADWTRERIAELQRKVDQNELPLINFNIAGTVLHHAAIVVSYKRTNEGTTFKVIDSNFTNGLNRFHFDPSDNSAYYPSFDYKNMGIALMREEDYANYMNARNSYCAESVDESARSKP